MEFCKPKCKLASTAKSKLKTRRGFDRKRLKSVQYCKVRPFTISGTNSAGLGRKKESLFSLINTLKPSIVMLQETKCLYYRTVTIPGYKIFENIPSEKIGGGLLTAAHVDLNPIVITDDENVEILVIQVEIENLKVRLINAYGPQEDDEVHKINIFWQAIEEEIVSAKQENCLVILELDANAKVGKDFIQGDPHPMSKNGRILIDLVQRQGFHIANSDAKCRGVITRERIFETKVEKSVIDYIILCDGIKDFLDEMVIDEEKKYILRHVNKRKGASDYIKSDHNVLIAKFSLKMQQLKPSVRKEIFNFKSAEGKRKFYEDTNNTTTLSTCFSKNGGFDASCKSFYKELHKKFHKSFSEIRIKSDRTKCGNKLIQIRLHVQNVITDLLKTTKCTVGKQMLNNLFQKTQSEIDDISARANSEKITRYLSSCNPDNDGFCQNGFWKLKKFLCPPKRDPPMAKRDCSGNLVTEPQALKRLYLETYTERLRHREIKPGLEDIKILKTELWNSRLTSLEMTPSANWKPTHLKKVLRNLKNNISMDPNGMVNELFKEGTIGSDLEAALLSLFNGCREVQHVPTFMTLSNITTIYKNKGSRLLLENDRGVFIQTVLKKILDKLIYNDVFKSIDNNMSDCNIGARSGRNIRDHLFVLYAVINSVVRDKYECIDVQIYDIQKAFDALWLDNSFNDLYDSLDQHARNDSISLLYKTNISNMVSVNTPVGPTDRVNMPEIIQQGGVWGSILCSNSIDKIGRKCRDTGNYVYKYKNRAEILPLAFIDDLNAIAKCGPDSKNMNTYLNTEIELKKLSFHITTESVNGKCLQMHVGKINSECPQLKVHGYDVQKVNNVTYLGDKVSADARNTRNIQDRVRKGAGIIGQIMKILHKTSFGTATVEIALLMRESLLINGMLTNAEIWHNLTQAETEELDKIDRLFFQKLCRVPSSTPKPAF